MGRVSPRLSAVTAGLLLLAAVFAYPQAGRERPADTETSVDALTRAGAAPTSRADVLAACDMNRTQNSPELETLCDGVRSGSAVGPIARSRAARELASRLNDLYALDD